MVDDATSHCDDAPFWEAVRQTRQRAVKHLLAQRREDGCWDGELSSSALATATAVIAVAKARQATATKSNLPDEELAALIRDGSAWLIEHQNSDGGWGDTTISQSNLAASLMGYSALAFAPDEIEPAPAVAAVEHWLRETVNVSQLSGQAIADALAAQYGGDHTFSAPLLTACILAGRLDKNNWPLVASLPFELSILPHRLLKWLGLPVVSYALPALIAIGQVRHANCPTRWPGLRWLRNVLRRASLQKLRTIQPDSGGYLEAAPLTSFVTMCLAELGQADNPVVSQAVQFLRNTVRPDGSWPIDTNLATWVTTLSVQALGDDLSGDAVEAIRNSLLARQQTEVHPFTQTVPGGWGWTDLSGSVPDGDDTPGALLALLSLWQRGHLKHTLAIAAAVQIGVEWLLELQNRDGGWPTFCKGWGKLPFDRSCCDLTAHVLAALALWLDASKNYRREEASTPPIRFCPATSRRIESAIEKGMQFLHRQQREDGAWLPLWFGNEQAPGQENPVYGTARVVQGLYAATCLPKTADPNGSIVTMIDRGKKFLLGNQNPDGSWGGAAGVPGSIEETALAVQTLASDRASTSPSREAIGRGAAWLMERTNHGTQFPAAPIGLYFASLWYHEKLYPVIFTIAALRAAKHSLGDSADKR